MMFVLATLDVDFHSMITLTYGRSYPLDGRITKMHLNRFLTGYRRKFYGSYFWFIEFQKRGAPHFHVFSQVRSPSSGHRRRMSRLWCSSQGYKKGWMGYYSRLDSRSTRAGGADVFTVNRRPEHWESFKSADGAIRYAAKYSLKMEQKEVPLGYANVGRFWGCSRELKPRQPVAAIWNAGEDEVRQYIEAQVGRCHDWEYLPKYVFGTKADSDTQGDG